MSLRLAFCLTTLFAAALLLPGLAVAQEAAHEAVEEAASHMHDSHAEEVDDFSHEPDTFAMYIYKGLGIRYSFYFLCLYLMQLIAWVAAIGAVIRSGSRPSESVLATIRKGDPRDGWAAIQSDGSYVAGLIKKVLAVPGSGSQASRLLARQHEADFVRSRLPIAALAWIGVGAFCVGLYGTVDGWVVSCQVLQHATNLRASTLVEGTGFALVTSYLGLGIACSTAFWYGIFSVIHRRRMATAALTAEEILIRLRPEPTPAM